MKPNKRVFREVKGEELNPERLAEMKATSIKTYEKPMDFIGDTEKDEGTIKLNKRVFKKGDIVRLYSMLYNVGKDKEFELAKKNNTFKLEGLSCERIKEMKKELESYVYNTNKLFLPENQLVKIQKKIDEVFEGV